MAVFKPSIKQAEALTYLFDSTTLYIGYGGSAFSGKSYLLCWWITTMCVNYAGTAWGIGRKELSTLRKTTLVTLFKVLQEIGYVNGKHYNFNQQTNILTFKNNSKIYLIDTAYQPSDPLYTRFGGLELTGCAVDESAETDREAIQILFTRIGRCLNEKYGIKKKMLETFNPAKNHVYDRYYLPWRSKTLPLHTKFVKALPRDNPSPEVEDYIRDILATANKVTIERLIHGNFEYDDDPRVLCDYDAICDIFTNHHVLPSGVKRISADLAMQGRDKFVVGFWNGLVCNVEIDQTKSTGKGIEQDLRQLMIMKQVGRSSVVADSDGMGNYLESYLSGIKAFHGGSKAVNSIEYANIKAECAYKLAEYINARKIKVICTEYQRNQIIEELGVLKADDIDADDKKKRIIKKDEMKELINRSPDYLDMLIMGMLFHVQLPEPVHFVSRG